MPSPFREAADEAAAEIDAWTGEDFLITPQAAPLVAGFRDVNAATVPDTARAPILFRGTFIARGAQLHARGRNLPEPTTSGIVASQPYVRDVVMSLPYEAQRDDLITRTDTGERFRVASVMRRQLGRPQINLVEA